MSNTPEIKDDKGMNYEQLVKEKYPDAVLLKHITDFNHSLVCKNKNVGSKILGRSTDYWNPQAAWQAAYNNIKSTENGADKL